MDQTTIKATRNFGLRQADPLRHFARDGPWFRLAALFLCKLPSILVALGALIVVVGRFAKLW